MPYVDLCSGDDSASIWYTTNAPNSLVSGFDPTKPTIIMLHPVTFDSTWFINHLDDPRIGAKYNIIAFDSRFSGRSQTRLSGKIDYWVFAADLAYACQVLHLPAAHVWAEETEAVCVALRFASLFPEMCLSLALVTVPPLQEPQVNLSTAADLLRMWGYAESLEDFEHAISEMLHYTAGKDLPPEKIDRIVGFWQRTYPPFRRTRLVGLFNTLVYRTAMTSSTLARIRHPVLLIHGEKNEHRPLRHAEELLGQLRNAQEARLAVVRGCAGFLSLLPSSCSIAIQFYTKFLCGLPPASTDLRPPSMAIPDRMAAALKDLAGICGRNEIAERSARSCTSFSLTTLEVEQHQMDAFRFYRRGERGALSPLDVLGRPLRSYTSRYADHHWFSIDVGSDSLALDRSNPSTYTPLLPHTSPTEPVSPAVNSERRVIPAVSQNARERRIIKSSSRTSLTTGIPLARFLSTT